MNSLSFLTKYVLCKDFKIALCPEDGGSGTYLPNYTASPYALKMEAAIHIYQTTRRLIAEDCDRNIHRSHRDFSEYRTRQSGLDVGM